MSYSGFCYLLKFFTSLPLLPHRQVSEEQKGQSLALLPIWAALLAASCGLLAYGLSLINASVAAACVVGFDFALTGGRRPLGVQRLSSALAAGPTKQEKMTSAWYGTAATPAGWAGLSLVLFIKYILYMQIILQGEMILFLPTAIFYAYSLWPVLFMTCPLRNYLADAEYFRRHYKKKYLYVCSLISFLILAILMRQLFILCALVLILILFLCRRWAVLLGGLASLELFAACEWAEIFLLAFVLFFVTIF